jgi:ketosteroid isomerase-like protein
MTPTVDEQAIRTLVATWLAATKRGDRRAVLDLMTARQKPDWLKSNEGARR